MKQIQIDLERKYIIKDSPCFIGVKKGNEDLLRWVNVFILHKKLGGNLAISEKWLGLTATPIFVGCNYFLGVVLFTAPSFMQSKFNA